MDLSELIPFRSLDDLADIRAGARAAAIEGLMLKRRDSPYLPGRPKGHWWKWKRDPLTVDAVLMYAQRGHGKRSSFYSDYTFGLWREDGELVPVGKAYFGFTDAELAFLDRWVRNAYDRPFRPGARGRERHWCWRSRSMPRSSRPGTNPASRCASPASRAFARTSRPPRRIVWKP